MHNEHIDRMLEMTSDAWTNVEKQVTLNMYVGVARDSQMIQSSDWPK